MAYPKFLPREKKSTFNMRMNTELLDKITQYALLTETTVTDIVTDLIKEFIEGKVVYNNYLDYGITINIPLSELGKNEYIEKGKNLVGLKVNDTIFQDEEYIEIPTETIEVKKIPNNLDIFLNNTFQSEFEGFLHDGLEFYVVTDYIKLIDFSFVPDLFYLNNLYCLYFRVDEEGELYIFMIDYLDAINYLEGKDDITKDKLIACVTELKNISRTLKHETIKLEEITDEEKKEKKAVKVVENLNSKLIEIANTYNSDNIIPFGKDIDLRILENEVNVVEDIDEKIDKLESLMKEQYNFLTLIEKILDGKNLEDITEEDIFNYWIEKINNEKDEQTTKNKKK